MSVQWVNLLNKSNSRLHKEEVLAQALTMTKLGDTGAIRFLSLLKICYDPMITFGVKKVPQTAGYTDRENDWQGFADLLNSMHLRTLTSMSGHNARDSLIAMSEKFDSDEWNNFCAPIIMRDIRCGITATTINKVVKGTDFVIPVFSCQLAMSGEGRPEMSGQVRLEVKLDGTRALIMVQPYTTSNLTHPVYGVEIRSRNGQAFDNFNLIEEQINAVTAEIIAKVPEAKYGFVLDGEIMSESFQTLMKQLRRKKNVRADDAVFNLFDFIPLDDFKRGYWNATQEKRISILESIRPIVYGLPNISYVDFLNVDLDTAAGWDQYNRYAQDCVDAGFEGVMIKKLGAPYQCRRSTHWMKYKPVYTYDLQVVGMEEGTGKYVGKLGAIICSGVEDGKNIFVNVGSGFTDEQRIEFYNPALIGKTIEVMADAITKNEDGTYSLRFPRFKTFRPDKDSS